MPVVICDYFHTNTKKIYADTHQRASKIRLQCQTDQGVLCKGSLTFCDASYDVKQSATILDSFDPEQTK